MLLKSRFYQSTYLLHAFQKTLIRTNSPSFATMKLKQILAAFKYLALFAFWVLSLGYVFKLKQDVRGKVFDYKQEYSSFKDQSKHHGKLLLNHLPRLQINLKDQNLKSFIPVFNLNANSGSFLASFYAPDSGYFKIIHLFFLKHQILLYPFHSLW
ncbi:hypothetical protein [Desertivirga brevis]|uniref:hypothetical protein n=1 Tax=Desertivirga brevis TaxID=2810310 RepID=UPI001A96D355|nr:hypothetical protein [Pedobacter sp. SYSU D00873]